MGKPQQIRDHIAYFLQEAVKAYEIDGVCDRLGMPVVEDAWTYNSKRVYVQNRLAGVPAETRKAARRLAKRREVQRTRVGRFAGDFGWRRAKLQPGYSRGAAKTTAAPRLSRAGGCGSFVRRLPVRTARWYGRVMIDPQDNRLKDGLVSDDPPVDFSVEGDAFEGFEVENDAFEGFDVDDEPFSGFEVE